MYFIVPFLRHLTQHGRPGILIGLTCIWLLLTILFLLRIDGLWSSPLLLYSGYLLFGYCLYRLQWPPVPLLILTGCISLILTDYMVISQSLAEAQYVFGRWLSYKTINTVFTAGMVFAIGRYWAGKMKPKQLEFCSFMSGHSLGIYLLHPVFLWPIRAYDLYFFHPIIMIPLWTMIVTALALGASWLLRTNRYTGWLVP
ncbi:acyltransferase family protein [Salidesulfovibrio onnuriiensis]|uniref:acyltransferase family protein n=1 Tax=Salidesulfovibrio onnuriiensis TaxID=2583823 RepID=UPI0032B83F14